MWKSFEIKGKNFIFKVKSEENSLTVTLSDLKCIWSEKITSSDILSRFKEMNPLFESNENIKDTVTSMISNIDNALEVNTESEDDTLILRVKTQLEKKYMIGFRFILTKLPGEDFFSKITLPMVQTILNLEQAQCDLHNILEKKDRELQEYKLEKGEISREDLKTKPFISNVRNEKSDGLMLNLFKKNFLPEDAYVDANCQPESDFKKIMVNDVKKMGPLKRKIYSAKNCSKKHLTKPF
ncbi:uncharacterized protein LOC123320410 [Coccinella septempunctata]|uniref:uncharacterized protein LOC123320410 n=1 Tax=Coccinella septempunctata TaxID=41139 RepID=UPI001D05D0ED|nr:uncharacterized protein LOC123320410 [Coccinella septempunctata]